jgi:hypothetical protein
MTRTKVRNNIQAESTRTSRNNAAEILREHDILVLTGTGKAVSTACEFLGQSGQPAPVFADGDWVG